MNLTLYFLHESNLYLSSPGYLLRYACCTVYLVKCVLAVLVTNFIRTVTKSLGPCRARICDLQ